MQKFLKWLVYSSANADQIGMTVKGALLGVVPALAFLLGVAHVKVGSDQLNEVVDGVVMLLQTALTVVAAVVFLAGLGRKLWSTYKGENAVLNQ